MYSTFSYEMVYDQFIFSLISFCIETNTFLNEIKLMVSEKVQLLKGSKNTSSQKSSSFDIFPCSSFSI